MKKLIYLLVAVMVAIGIASCSKKEEGPQKWEYKIVQIWGVNRGSFISKGIPVPEDTLNKLGNEGWELVDVYSRIETVHPNFGNEKYVTGLQPNTRTEAFFFVLKRQITDASKQDNNAHDNDVEVEEVTEVVEVATDSIIAD